MLFKEGVRLARYTSLKVGGPAKYFAQAKTERDVRDAILWAQEKALPYFILGGGTNVVISDQGYNGLVLAVKNTDIKFFDQENGAVLMQVSAGTLLQEAVDASLDRGLSGLEWAAGVPGQVGGAIRGNAGAFGGEMKDVIEGVDVIMPDGTPRTFSNEECNFFYRSSIFKEQPGGIIISSTLRLANGEKDTLLQRAEGLRAWRREKHPIEYPNCGSVFKRIEAGDVRIGMWNRYPDMKEALRDDQIATAYFIDKCGLKNFRIGGAEVSEKHPNFIINRTGRAKAEHVVLVANHVRARVQEKFGILLEEEPEFVL